YLPSQSPSSSGIRSFFFLSCCVHHPHLRSFPTRRSSDLFLPLQELLLRVPLGLFANVALPSHLALGSLPLSRFVIAWESGNEPRDRKSTRLNSSHVAISYAVFCLKKKNLPCR